jgi:hypothetical protein
MTAFTGSTAGTQGASRRLEGIERLSGKTCRMERANGVRPRARPNARATRQKMGIAG